MFGTEDLSVILNSGLPHPVSPASGDLPQHLRCEEIGRRGLGVRGGGTGLCLSSV